MENTLTGLPVPGRIGAKQCLWSFIEYCDSRLAARRPRSAPAGVERLPSLAAHASSSPERGRLEAFIAAEYDEHFGARIEQFMPVLVGSYNADGSVAAVVGCRSAASEPLFLETYTQRPIESVLRDATGFEVSRNEIVEVGNLACTSGHSATTIVRALVPYLIGSGFTWVVFTAADTVQRVFARLRLEPRPLCRADASLLGDARSSWGSYYDHDPVVMGGRLADGFAATDCAAGVQ